MSIDKSIIGEIKGIILGISEHKITVKLKDEFILDIPKNVFIINEKYLIIGTKIIYQIKENENKIKYQEIIEDISNDSKSDTNSDIVKEFLDTK